MRKPWPKLLNLVTAGGGIALFFLLARIEPAASGFGTHQKLIPIPCLFKYFFWINCPSCGLTTSLSYLLHGKLALAFTTHPFGPFVFLAIVALIVFALASFFTGKAWWRILNQKWLQNLALIFITLYLVVWIIRLMWSI